MLFAGVQSSDHAFASTGIATAGLLGWPHGAVVANLTYAPGAKSAVFRRELEGGLLHEVEVQCPAVLTIQAGINTPRYASLRSIKQAAAKPIDVRSLADVGVDAADVGAAGSLSRVRRMYIPEKGRAQLIEGSPAEQAQRLAAIIREFKGVGMMGSILVIAEQRRGELRPVSLELVAAAQAIRGAGDTVAVAILGPDPARFTAALGVAGVDEIVTVETAAAEFDPDTFEAAVGALVEARGPAVVLTAHSVDSFGYTAALAAKRGYGFATDVFRVERIDGVLVATRGGYGQEGQRRARFSGSRDGAARAAREHVEGAGRARRAGGDGVRAAGFGQPLDRARVRRGQRRRRRRHDGRGVHPDDRPRRRRGSEDRAVPRARRRTRRDARLLAADR